MEEEEEEQDTSIKGRLMAIIYKIKGRPQKTEEQPTEKEQAAPSKTHIITFSLRTIAPLYLLLRRVCANNRAVSERKNILSWFEMNLKDLKD